MASAAAEPPADRSSSPSTSSQQHARRRPVYVSAPRSVVCLPAELNSRLRTTITITNETRGSSGLAVAFKIKCTHPSGVQVKPASGTIPAGETVTADVTISAVDEADKIKFLLWAAPASTAKADGFKWEESGAVQKLRIACEITDSPPGEVTYSLPGSGSNLLPPNTGVTAAAAGAGAAGSASAASPQQRTLTRGPPTADKEPTASTRVGSTAASSTPSASHSSSSSSSSSSTTSASAASTAAAAPGRAVGSRAETPSAATDVLKQVLVVPFNGGRLAEAVLDYALAESNSVSNATSATAKLPAPDHAHAKHWSVRVYVDKAERRMPRGGMVVLCHAANFSEPAAWSGGVLHHAAAVVLTTETVMPAEAAALAKVFRAHGVRHLLYIATPGIAAAQRPACSGLLRACSEAHLPVTLVVPGAFYDDFANVWPVTRTFWLRRLVWWGVPLRLDSTACTFLPMLSRHDFGAIVLGLAAQPAKNDLLYAIAECSPLTTVLGVLGRAYSQPVAYLPGVSNNLRDRLSFPDRPANWEDVSQNRLELSSALCHALQPDCLSFEQWAEAVLPHGVDRQVERAVTLGLYASQARALLRTTLAAAAATGGVVYMLHYLGYVQVTLPAPASRVVQAASSLGAAMFHQAVAVSKRVVPSSFFTYNVARYV
eukprot:m.175044 g.175044  ORF g.175044 m.175044 type:complete len:658 (+) comp17339_c1_seq3:109-2082(+)